MRATPGGHQVKALWASIRRCWKTTQEALQVTISLLSLYQRYLLTVLLTGGTRRYAIR